jgi:hypothetical protein
MPFFECDKMPCVLDAVVKYLSMQVSRVLMRADRSWSLSVRCDNVLVTVVALMACRNIRLMRRY